MQPPVHFFFFNDTATTEIYTLSLHDALPIFQRRLSTAALVEASFAHPVCLFRHIVAFGDRKSTRLNSSHQIISYAVFCLKKKKNFSLPQYSYSHPTHSDDDV